MEQEHAGKVAWAVLIGAIASYDYFCPKGQTLSEAIDRALEHRQGRYVAIGAIAVTGAHLLNLLPEAVDPLARLGKRFGR